MAAGSPTRLVLEAIAEVQAAKQKIQDLAGAVVQLGDTVEKNAAKKFAFDTTEALNKLDGLEKGLQSIASISEKTKVIKVNADVDQAQKEIQGLAQTTEREFKKIADQAKKNPFANLSDSAAKEAKELQNELKKAETAFKNAVDKLNRDARRFDFDPASKSAQRLRDAVRLAAEDILAKVGKIPPGLQKLGTGFQNVQAQAEKAAAALKQFPKETPIPQSWTDNFNAASTALRGFLASLAVQKLKEFVEAVVETTSKMEGLRNTFAAVFGGKQAGAEEFNRLRETAETLGLNLELLVERFGRFAVAGKAAGLQTQEIRDIFDAFTAASRGVNQSTFELERTLTALEQIMSKGVVQSEELKQQLGDVLPGAFTLMARAIGVTTQELEKMLKQNELLATRALPALASELLKTFGPAIISNAQSVRAEIERFKNDLLIAKDTIGQKLAPELKELIGVFRSAGEEGQSAFENIGESLGRLLDRIADVANVLHDAFTFNFKALLAELASLVAEIVADLTAGAEDAAAGLLGIFSPELAQKFREFEGKGSDTFRQLAEGYGQMAEEFRGHNKTIADNWNETSQKVTDDMNGLKERLIKQSKEAADAQIADSEKVRKQEAKDIQKRQEAFEAFFKKLGDLANNVPEPKLPKIPNAGNVGQPSGDFVSDGQIAKITEADTKLAKLKQTLIELQQKKEDLERDSYVTGGQIAEVTKLDGEIQKTKESIRQTEEAIAQSKLAEELKAQADAAEKTEQAMKKFADSVKDALVGLVRDTDAFREAFLALDTDSQKAVESLITGLERIANAGNVTQEDLQKFSSQLAQIFGDAGVVSSDFATQLQAAFGVGSESAATLIQRLGELGDATVKQGEAADIARKANEDAAGSALHWDEATKTLTNTVAEGTKVNEDYLRKADELVATLKTMEGQTITTEQAQTLFGATLTQLESRLDALGVSYVRAGDSLKVFTDETDSAGGGTIKFGDQIIEIGKKAEDTGKKVEDAGKKIGELGDEKVPPETPESIADVGKAGEDAASGLDSAAAAAGDAKTGIQDVANAAKDLAQATIPESLPAGIERIGTAATTSGPAVVQFSEGVKALVEALNSLDPSKPETIQTLGAAITTAAAALQTAIQPAQSFAAAIDQAAAAIGRITIGAFDPLITLGDILPGLIEPLNQVTAPLGEMATGFERVGAALAAIGSDKAAVFEALAASLASISEPIATAAAAFPQLTTGVQASATAADQLKTAMEGIQGLAETLGAAIQALATLIEGAGLGDQLTTLGAAFTTLSGPLQAVSAGFAAIQASFAGIGESSAAVQTAIESLGEAMAAQIEAGTVEEFGKQFAALQTATQGIAEDLGTISTALVDFAAAAEPTAEAIQTLSDAFGNFNIQRVVNQVQALNGAVAKMAGLFDRTKTSLDKLAEALVSSEGAFQRVTTAAGNTATKLSTVVVPAIKTEAIPAISALTKALEDDRKQWQGILSEISRLDSEATPAINRTSQAVNNLTAALQEAAKAAGDLATALASIPSDVG